MVTVDLEMGGSVLRLASFKTLAGFFGVDLEIGDAAMRLSITAAVAALLVVACVVVCRRPKVARLIAVMLGVLAGAATTWVLVDVAVMGQQRAARQALEARAWDLAARGREPGSALSCLDGLAGETVEAACEKALFASPASVAAAVSYVTARFDLLSDMTDYAGDGGRNMGAAFGPLQRALATDRFGFLAHVLAVRDGCTAENCQVLTVLRDSSQVRAHLSSGTFDGYLGRYSAAWNAPAEAPVADAAQSQTAAASEPAEHPQRKVVVDIDFPSAASIPPVSIMNPEPSGKALPGVAAAAAANPNPPAASVAVRRPPKSQSAGPAAAPAPSPPISPDAQADPVWTPAPSTPPPPPTAAAAAPAQLNPFASSR
jgi:hypothetical protein